jgi:hypothetical protein
MQFFDACLCHFISKIQGKTAFINRHNGLMFAQIELAFTPEYGSFQYFDPEFTLKQIQVNIRG